MGVAPYQTTRRRIPELHVFSVLTAKDPKHHMCVCVYVYVVFPACHTNHCSSLKWPDPLAQSNFGEMEPSLFLCC